MNDKNGSKINDEWDESDEQDEWIKMDEKRMMIRRTTDEERMTNKTNVEWKEWVINPQELFT